MKIDSFPLAQHVANELRPKLKLVPWEKWYWRSKPARVRIAIYAEGSVRFDGGSFDGLQHAIGALSSDPWWWVSFELTLIHRGADPSADEQHKRLDQIDLDVFDEVWLFGISGGDVLTAGEKAAMQAFMDRGGGVLHTGDHASLGQGIAGALPRAGKMRRYPAPPSSPPVWNTTLREGATPGYQFVDQSDDVGQPVRLRRYPLTTSWPIWSRRAQSHPLFCGMDGPIRVFPDHQHEGEAIAPTSYPASEWPSKGGFQPRVEVVAWGRIVDPLADKAGEEIGLVSAYDGHRADVGRIAADSTWHHWFDINLDGFQGSATGQAQLDGILNYFLNCAVWLAPPAKQRAMRNAMLWGAIWRHPFPDWVGPSHPLVLGGQARDVFGRYAPQCALRTWLLDALQIDLRELLLRWPVDFPVPVPPPPFEEVLLGAALLPLLEHVTKSGGVAQRDADLAFVDAAFDGAVKVALASVSEGLRAIEAEWGKVARFPGSKAPRVPKASKALADKPRSAKPATPSTTKKRGRPKR